MIEENFGETDDAQPGAGTDVTDEMSADNIEGLIEENKQLAYRLKCKIGFHEDSCMVVLPCGHTSTCPQCTAPLKECIICKKHLEGTVRALFA